MPLVFEVVAEEAYKSVELAQVPLESTRMEIRIWTQVPALMVEESLERVASNHPFRLDPEAPAEEEGQGHREEGMPGQPSITSSEVYDTKTLTFWNPASPQV
jgi:hypothetical protein